MSGLSYKELQEKGVFDVPYRAFEFMQSQQAEIDQLKAQLALCREENKGLVGSLNKQRKHHRESANKLTQKSIRLTDAEFEYKRIKGLQAKDCLQIMRLTARNEKLHDELKALRGERE